MFLESKSPVKSTGRHSQRSQSKHYKSSKSDKRKSKRGSFENSTSNYDSVSDTETDNEKSSKNKLKDNLEKSKTVQDTSKVKNIGDKDTHDEILDDGGDNMMDEYEEQPIGLLHL